MGWNCIIFLTKSTKYLAFKLAFILLKNNEKIVSVLMNIHRIINFPVQSNCYIISGLHSNACIVIDPGTERNNDLLAFLSANYLIPNIVILTHEHYDHCAGVNHLMELYNFDLVCSAKSSTNIANNKLNFSAYMDEYKTFSINAKAIIANNYTNIEFNSREIHFIETSGHSPGSLCIILDDAIFTGDTFMGGIKTPVKLPGGNKEDYHISIDNLKKIIKPGMKVYPGHGDPFLFQKWDN